MRSLFILGLVILLSTCGNENSETLSNSQDLNTIMPGTWESVSIKVTVHGGVDSDSIYLFDVPEKDWKRTLGINPIKTYYEGESGSTYYSEYTDSDGSIQSVTRGKWYVNGDSLLLVTPDATYDYAVQVNGGRGEFRAVLDWDGDGEQDDEYLGVQRKISNYTK